MFMHEAWPTNEMIPSLHRKVVQQALKAGVIKKQRYVILRETIYASISLRVLKGGLKPW
jgi:hypothetical protein